MPLVLYALVGMVASVNSVNSTAKASQTSFEGRSGNPKKRAVSEDLSLYTGPRVQDPNCSHDATNLVLDETYNSVNDAVGRTD